jgi:hypothetical protein
MNDDKIDPFSIEEQPLTMADIISDKSNPNTLFNDKKKIGQGYLFIDLEIKIIKSSYN